MRTTTAFGAVCILLASALPADASTGALSLTLDGVDGGFVSAQADKKLITISAEAPSRPLLGVVQKLLDGKATNKTRIRLETGGTIQKADDARLTDVRLPSYAGGSNDLALTFEAPHAVATSPSLRLASDRAKPQGVKLAGFRLGLGDLPTVEATRLDSIALKNKEGSAVPAAFLFDVPSNTAPAFQAWAKKTLPAAGRDGSIEYITSTGDLVLNVKLGGCTATSVKIDGPVTHVNVTCTRAR